MDLIPLPHLSYFYCSSKECRWCAPNVYEFRRNEWPEKGHSPAIASCRVQRSLPYWLFAMKISWPTSVLFTLAMCRACWSSSGIVISNASGLLRSTTPLLLNNGFLNIHNLYCSWNVCFTFDTNLFHVPVAWTWLRVILMVTGWFSTTYTISGLSRMTGALCKYCPVIWKKRIINYFNMQRASIRQWHCQHFTCKRLMWVCFGLLRWFTVK